MDDPKASVESTPGQSGTGTGTGLSEHHLCGKRAKFCIDSACTSCPEIGLVGLRQPRECRVDSMLTRHVCCNGVQKRLQHQLTSVEVPAHAHPPGYNTARTSGRPQPKVQTNPSPPYPAHRGLSWSHESYAVETFHI